MNKYRKALAAVPVLLALIVASCSSKPKSEVVQVATFGDTESIRMLREQLAKLEKETGIKTEPVFIPFQSFAQKIITQMAANQAPDVLWVEVGFFIDLRAAGALKSLSPYIKEDNFDTGIYYDGVMERFTQEGEVYALPNDTAPTACLYYNKRIFKEAGVKYPTDKWTWDDFLAAAKKLTKRDAKGHTEIWGFKHYQGLEWHTWAYANGGGYVDDPNNPTKSVMASPENIQAVNFLVDLVHKHKVTPTEAAKDSIGTTAADMFLNGNIAMFQSGYWPVGNLRRDGAKRSIEWDIAPFPKGPKAKKPGWGTGGSGWAITRDSRLPDKAWQVVKFLSGEKYQRILADYGGYQPAIKSLAKSEIFMGRGAPDNKAFMLKAPDYAIYSPAIPEWEEFARGTVDPAMDTVLITAERKPEAVLKELDAKLNKMLEKRRR